MCEVTPMKSTIGSFSGGACIKRRKSSVLAHTYALEHTHVHAHKKPHSMWGYYVYKVCSQNLAQMQQSEWSIGVKMNR